jgi:hypothetical protein
VNIRRFNRTLMRTYMYMYDADLLKIRAENATFNGILIGSVVMTEILVSAFDAVPGTARVEDVRYDGSLQ